MKIYKGVRGELYGVKFLPCYMMGWKNWQIVLVCWLLNRLPKRLVSRIENKLCKLDCNEIILGPAGKAIDNQVKSDLRGKQ